MKRFLAVLLCLLLLMGTVGADNVGDHNMGGGNSGGTGSGTAENTWHGGDDGVRVTVFKDGEAITAPFDIANEDWKGKCIGFKKKHKLYYKKYSLGVIAEPDDDGYTNIVLPGDLKMERVIGENGVSTIEEMEKYFTDERTVEYLAEKAGIPFEELKTEGYKLLLEPIAYFKYNGVMWAMTATEAARFDVQVNGDLRSKMVSLTHKNLPFSMFLEQDDDILGIVAWGTAAGTRPQSNLTIMEQLGVGVVTFQDTAEEVVLPTLPNFDYTYRTNTRVVTTVALHNELPVNLTPVDGVTVTFDILGNTYRVPFVCPSGSTQMVWVDWETPDTPQLVEIGVTCPTVDCDMTVLADVVALEEKEPPDPQYDGPGIGAGQYRENFEPVEEPDWGSCTRTTWWEWYAVYNEVAALLGGDPWDFQLAEYSAVLHVDYDLVPNERVQTEHRLGSGRYEMKSGYGVDVDCTVKVARSDGVSTADITPVQNVLAVFPEFDFVDYNRLLERSGRDYRTQWRFKENRFSYYKCRTHFTPLWYPDGLRYTVPLAVFDAWTPGGQLYATVSDYIDIDGGAVLDDWYIRNF